MQWPFMPHSKAKPTKHRFEVVPKALLFEKDNNQHIDSSFVNRAIDLFAHQFPHSITDYGILLNRVSVYSDAETEEERNDLMNIIGEQFQLSNMNLSSPILDETSLAYLQNSSQTQLVIVTQNHKNNFDALKKIFPQLANIKPTAIQTNTVFSFYDTNNRPIIILYAADQNSIRELVSKMKTAKHVDLQNLIQK